jgi:WD40 repeat protein
LLRNGDIKHLNIKSNYITKIEPRKVKANKEGIVPQPTYIEWSKQQESIAVIGYSDGFLVFLDMSSMSTLTLDVKKNKTVIQDVYDDMIDNLMPDYDANGNLVEVIDEGVINNIAWDPFEPNVLIGFSTGNMCLIRYDGLTESTQVQLRFEEMSSGIDSMAWMRDKSGNFVTTSKKMGILRIWNVAQTTPKRVIKVAGFGIHFMIALESQSRA